MSVDLEVLKKFGTTNERLRAVFTAEEGSEDHKLRTKWEDRIRSRIHEGAMFGLQNYQFYAAADLAWDGNLITKELVPLALYAQGKITLKELEPQLKSISEETRAKFVKKDEKDELVFDAPAFMKVMINIPRALITKRLATLSSRYIKQYPFLKYEPLGTSYVAQLRADALSQRVEMITNEYGYRHDLIQAIREMLTYSHIVEFVESQWDIEKTVRRKASAEGVGPDELLTETVISREGLLYKRPHPSRVFYDMAYPMASLNTDTGCSYIGYWDLVPYREIRDSKAFFNKDNIEFDSAFTNKIAAFKSYWALYAANSAVNFPEAGFGMDVAGANERDKLSGTYSSDEGDNTIMRTVYFEKIIPRDVGIGKYPYPVWVRLCVAADERVVFAEIIPYTPATVWQYNCADGKVLNNSFAHECIPWGDQASNMLTNLLYAQRAALIKIISADIDQIGDEKLVKQLRDMVTGDGIYTKPILIEHKGVQSAEMGLDHRQVVQISETTALADPTLYFRSLMQLLSIAERVLGTSANEQSQSEPREVSATESATIQGAVSTNVAFMGSGIDEAIAAKKKQLFNALMACGQSRVVVPVVNRYTRKTIKAAGFEPMSEDQEGEGLNENYIGDARKVTIVGTKDCFEYDYTYSSRDGADRPSETKAAEVLVQLLQPLSQIRNGELIASLGKQQVYDMFNAIFRKAGVGDDVRFDLVDGESDEIPSGDPANDGKAAMEQALSQIAGVLEQMNQRLTKLEQTA